MGGLTSLQGSSRCILQPQPTGQPNTNNSLTDIVTPPCAQRAFRVPSPPVKAGHRRWLWSAERYLMLQISPTPVRILCSALFWNLGFFHTPNYVFGFSTNKSNSLCVLILWAINGHSSCVFTLWCMNGNELIFRSLKIHHVLIFWRALLRYQSWSKVCFSADAHMVNREWGLPMPLSACNDREGWSRDGISHFHYSVILGCYYRPLILASPTTWQKY